MPAISVRVEGERRVRRNLDRLIRRAPIFFGEALRKEGDLVMVHSLRIVPREDGDLARSAKVEGPTVSAGRVRVELSYTSRYARRQHEDLTLSHGSGQSAKYLELPARLAEPSMPARIAQRLKFRINSTMRG